MSELYWITRLDNLEFLFAIMLIVGLIISVSAAIMYISCKLDEDIQELLNPIVKGIKISIPIILIGIFGKIFVPTTKKQ